MRVHPHASPNARRDAGFSLVELMVTVAIFAVVAVTVTLVLMNSARTKQRTTAHLEAEQTARAAMDLMARDIRSAGYGADLDWGTPQPAVAYVDEQEIILSQNQLPFPDAGNGPLPPLAYDPAATPRPYPLDGTTYAPPIRYRTGAELIRYTLDANNDGLVDANDITSPEGADAAASPNPDDFVLLRQVYGDSTGNVAGNNGGASERVALVTPWDWANGPVPPSRLADIQRVTMQVTAASSRPDSRGAYAQTTLQSEVNASRSVPDFGAKVYVVSGYVYADANLNRVRDTGETGLPGATVRLGSQVAYSAASGYYQFRIGAGTYLMRHTAPMGWGSYASPDSFNVTVV
ncbi:MAG: SdrD B-like domain, partial [Candidatus Eisenbacteria bacterium]